MLTKPKTQWQQFGMKRENDYLTGQMFKDKYQKYQETYRAEHGVYPELDKINNPFTTIWDDVKALPQALRNGKGFWNSLAYPDIVFRFGSKVKNIFKDFEKELSFAITVNLEHSSYIPSIIEMAPERRIENKLGYIKEENGDYLEGTFIHNRLAHGVIYRHAQNALFVGTFSKDNPALLRGVGYLFEGGINQCTQVTLQIGIFRERNGSFQLEQDLCLENITSLKDETVDCMICHYQEGYPTGRFIRKTMGKKNIFSWGKAKNGDFRYVSTFHKVITRWWVGFLIVYALVIVIALHVFMNDD